MNGPAAVDAGIRQGVATAPDAAAAVEELVAAIAQPSIGFAAVFCASRHNPTAIERGLAGRFGDGTLVGCTTAGEISVNGYTQGTLTGISLSREVCMSVSGLLPQISNFTPAEGRELAASLLHEIKLLGGQPTPLNTFGFLLIDGMAFTEEQVVSSIATSLGNIPLFGGSAGDDRQHRRTLVLHGGRFHSDAAVLTLVHTRYPFKVFSTHHFVGSEEQAIVTGAVPERRLVTELNGESAAREYARLVGQPVDLLRSAGSLLPPLVVKVGGAYYARSIEHINPDESLTLACAIDEGVPLSVARNVGMLDDLERAFAGIRRSVGKPVAVIGADCCMRRVEALRTGIQDEVKRLFAENRVIGFSAYGEQINAMHVNHTFTAVAIGSGAEAMRPSPRPAPQESPLDRLEAENAKLRKTVRVLLQRLERSMNVPGDTFSLFQNNVLLEETVRKRTADLAEVNRQLNHELVKRREIEAALLRTKTEADEANNSKTQFLAAVSHDLQQPLNAARLLLGALLEEPVSAGGRALLGRIENALETAEEMLGDFHDVAKLETGAVSCQPADYAIGPLLMQLAAEYLPQARRRGLSLVVVPSSAIIRTDRQMFQRVLRNLLANALRYTSQGRVLLGCRRRAMHLSVEVWDTGIGIPPDRIGEVFRPFFQVNKGNALGERGSGLGLTIVQRICAVLDHPLSVHSEEGRGSGFRLSVPYASDARSGEAAVLAGPTSPVEMLAGTRILALDDNASAREALAAILSAWRCEPVAASSIGEALRSLRPWPDVFVVDYHLAPGLSGLDALSAIAERAEQPIRAVVVTADHSPAIREAVRGSGYEFLPKPINPARLRSVITYLLCCQEPTRVP